MKKKIKNLIIYFQKTIYLPFFTCIIQCLTILKYQQQKEKRVFEKKSIKVNVNAINCSNN